MAKKKDKQFREEIKAPDRFEDFWENMGSWLGANKVIVFSVLCLVLLIGAFFSFQNKKMKRIDAKAMDALIAVQKNFSNQSFDERLKAVNGLVESHQKSSLKSVAQLYLGASYYQNKNWDEAEKAYQAAKNNLPKSHQMFAIEALANIASEKGEQDKAKKLYQSLVNMNDNALKDYHSWNLIVLSAQSKDEVTLKNQCDGFEQNFPKSVYLDDVKLFCVAK